MTFNIVNYEEEAALDLFYRAALGAITEPYHLMRIAALYDALLDIHRTSPEIIEELGSVIIPEEYL